MTETVVVVSGYFNPLHVGHVRMMRAAKQLGDLLVVVVNNDRQQILKKGRIIINERDRAEVVESVGVVDRVISSVDDGPSVRATLAKIRQEYPGHRIIFANGGDRRDADSIAEAATCKDLDIEIEFGVGGGDKADASSRIIAELGV